MCSGLFMRGLNLSKTSVALFAFKSLGIFKKYTILGFHRSYLALLKEKLYFQQLLPAIICKKKKCIYYLLNHIYIPFRFHSHNDSFKIICVQGTHFEGRGVYPIFLDLCHFVNIQNIYKYKYTYSTCFSSCSLKYTTYIFN